MHSIYKEAKQHFAPTLLRERDAAKYLAISERHLFGIRTSGQIKYVRLGTSIRYRVADLEQFAAEQTQSEMGA